jgi:hypothetical protein
VSDAAAHDMGRRMTDHIEPCGELKVVMSEVGNLKSAEVEQWQAINALRNRLPTWATLGISLMAAGLASAITVIVMLANHFVQN